MDKKLLSTLSLMIVSLVSALSVADQLTCDSDAGKKQFNKCVACHSIEADTHKMGPSLHRLMGRIAGTAAGFSFSYAMEQVGFEWTEETLTEFLKSPMQMVPGTVMPFGSIKKAEQREALTCYIQQLK